MTEILERDKDHLLEIGSSDPIDGKVLSSALDMMGLASAKLWKTGPTTFLVLARPRVRLELTDVPGAWWNWARPLRVDATSPVHVPAREFEIQNGDVDLRILSANAGELPQILSEVGLTISPKAPVIFLGSNIRHPFLRGDFSDLLLTATHEGPALHVQSVLPKLGLMIEDLG